jgi:hypothetical protein
VTARAGHTLAELTVTLFLAGFLGATLAALVGGATRSLQDLVPRSEAAEVRRTVGAILHEELSVGVAGRDWHLDGERAVVLRAFRGYGRVCGPAADGSSWLVAWVGQRAPDPARDSLLVLQAGGNWVATPLVGHASQGTDAVGTCLPESGEAVAAWVVPDVPPPVHAVGVEGHAGDPLSTERPVLARYFETGRYSLEDGAFRYRRGAGGRQPLTPERVDRASRFHPIAGTDEGRTGIEVELVLDLARGAHTTDRWILRGDPSAGGPGGPP